MEPVPIAELRPELPGLETKQIKAVVSLLWPYSSSTRQFALLLAEPDFRLRHKKGQTRVRFTRSCAKAIAATGIGIGDTVILALQGAQFVERDTEIRTPGRSIDWELSFSQTLVIQIFRDGNEIANLDIVNAAPTPAPRSPVRRELHATPTQTPLKNSTLRLGDAPQWSSPAFLKRSRLSDGPFFEAGYDPLAISNEDGHDKKRRRKSFKDWNVWTYSARTPSPEKDDPVQDNLASSPLRLPSLPATPISPLNTKPCSVAALPPGVVDATDLINIREEDGSYMVDNGFEIEKDGHWADGQKITSDDFVRDADYYDLYAGPNEFPPSETQYTYGGDTEPNTEEEEEEEDGGIDISAEAQELVEIISGTEACSDVSDEGPTQHDIADEFEPVSDLDSSKAVFEHNNIASSTEEDSVIEIEEDFEGNVGAVGWRERRDRERSWTEDAPAVFDDGPPVVMPPPTLPFLQTDFPSRVPGMLTPIGIEPQSPTLKPLDSSTLPMPSPFPGDRDGQLTSYLDRSPIGQHPAHQEPSAEEGQEPSSEANYIVDSSFYSSVSASNSRSGHPDHESAFTDVRFTFGMDGSIFSRPKDPSESLAPQDADMEDNDIVPENTDNKASMRQKDDKDFQEEVNNNFTIEQGNSDSVVQEEVEGKNALDIVDEHHFLQGETEDNAIVQPERAFQDEIAQHRTSDIFDEFTTQDPSSVVHELVGPHINLPNSDHVSEHPQTIAKRRTKPEVIFLSSDTESESEVEEADVADLAEEDEYDVGSDEGFRKDEEQQLAPVAIPSGEDPTHSDEQPVFKDQQSSEFRDNNVSDNIQQPAVAVEIIDLGSGPENDRDDGLPTGKPTTMNVDAHNGKHVEVQKANAHPINVPEPYDQGQKSVERRYGMDSSVKVGGSSESLGVKDSPNEFATVVDASEEEDLSTNTNLAQTTRAELDEDDQPMAFDTHETQLATDNLDDFTPDAVSKQGETQEPDAGGLETMEDDPDIKMESVEDGSLFQLHHRENFQVQDNDDEPVSGPSAEIMIPLPTEGHKVGELEYRAVPATGPARNTRSKTKSSMSPAKDETLVLQPNTRSRRSKTSLTSTMRVSVPPSDAESQSSMKEAHSTSPYNLRSQSKFLSPAKSVLSPNVTIERGSHRKRHTRQKSDKLSSPLESSFSEVDPNRFGIDFPESNNFEPSQELGTSKRGKFANISFVRNSEEESLHSEHSISTLPWSDPVGPITPRKSEVTRGPAVDLSSDMDAEDETTPKVLPVPEQVAYPDLPMEGEGKGDHVSSSPLPLTHYGDWIKPLPAGHAKVEERIPSSPPPVQHESIASHQQPLANSNMLITPEPTQLSFNQSQPTFSAGQLEQSLPMTPELTQTTSADVVSFTANVKLETEKSPEMEEVSHVLKGQPISISKAAPGQNMTRTDVSSPDSPDRSPSIRSEDLSNSEDEATLIANLEPPSMGLSTPISYYTPLKDLRYFLNRSSQHHSSENPDMLALVTSATTLPKKAEKGPKHWNTTLHITDLSLYPVSVTVQIFRPYARALPVAEKGDVVLLRAFHVRSLNGQVMLRSGEESGWCVWRYGKPIWGTKRGEFGDVRAREEIRGPAVEQGEDEWREVERLRGWWMGSVRKEIEEKETERGEEKNKASAEKGKGKATENGAEEVKGNAEM
ncbi:hypothetical protein K505DRAFT_421240 [Melanomma pulvis-pyrius CBS 109.77]|uniref:Telomeric single stranded DNA binding POT1/Cdc13 domain-containing protein n=1 Tax=Melanomma pulvis-pyrius CBS 109.77 TaxID=1314802 RepID=A0A6A6WWE7_9PLEO|nr:hypothetical protein K505DRAFT_421240 [Melanomma pulvis-pyrius CBS 109.77]